MRSNFTLIVTFLLLLLSSCTKTEYITVPEYHTEYINKVDSFIQHDSIFQDRNIYLKGDTVFVTNTLYKYHDRYIPKYETVIKTDSVPYPVEVEVVKEVEKKLSWWQRIRIFLGEVLLVILIGLAIGLYLHITEKIRK